MVFPSQLSVSRDQYRIPSLSISTHSFHHHQY